MIKHWVLGDFQKKWMDEKVSALGWAWSESYQGNTVHIETEAGGYGDTLYQGRADLTMAFVEGALKAKGLE